MGNSECVNFHNSRFTSQYYTYKTGFYSQILFKISVGIQLTTY
jgi:hypothetical protein